MQQSNPIGGFNLPEKYKSQIGSSSQLGRGNKSHVPNHQPANQQLIPVVCVGPTEPYGENLRDQSQGAAVCCEKRELAEQHFWGRVGDSNGLSAQQFQPA